MWILGVKRPRRRRPDDGVAGLVGARERDNLDLIALGSGQHARVATQEADRALHDGVKYGLNVRLRTADDAQDVAGGGLLLQCLSNLGVRRRQGTILLLQFREQAHVLDGDDGLVGKSLQQRDLLIGEWIYFGPSQGDRPDCRSLSQQRNGQSRPIAELPSEGTVLGEFLLFSLHVSQMNGPPFEDGA